MNYTKLPKKVLLLLATPVLFSLAVPAGKLVAQSQTETKIRLMAEGLRARDSGDFVTAKTNFEQLLVLAPNDVTVQRLLAGVNETLAKGATAPAAVEAAPTTATAPAAAPAAEPVEVVYDPNKPAKPAASVPASAEPAAVAANPDARAGELAKAEEVRVKQLIKDAEAEAKAAQRLAKDGDLDGAAAKYDAAARSLPVNTLTQETLANIEAGKNDLLIIKSQNLLKQGDTEGAKKALDAYIAATSPEAKAARKQAERINQAELNPPLQPIEKVNPDFVAEQKRLAVLVSKGRSQYVAGDIDGALETFRLVETSSAENPEAKYFLKRIAEDKAKLGTLDREKTRALMLEEVAKGWQRPGLFVEKPIATTTGGGVSSPLRDKMNEIIIPSVSFTGVEMGRVISTLSALSTEYDTKSPEAQKGVNLVLSNQLPGVQVPQVNITLRNMSLKRILDIVTENAGYQYEVQPDLVLIKPSGTDVNLVNEQFPVSKAAIIRMTGSGAASAATPAAAADPFAPAPAAGAPTGGATGGESEGIRRFLQAAGVPFDTVPGASLAYDGASILVTHTSRNIDRIRNILGRYNDVRQVEIEAKFIDVNEGALEELGVTWTANGRGSLVFDPTTGAPVLGTDGKQLTGNYQTQLSSQNRSLVNAFTSSTSASGGSITNSSTGINIPITNNPPSLPGTVGLGGSAGALATISGSIGEFDVSAMIRALSQRTGSDLLSAPKVTVLSGNRATITVAQELRYPQSYGEIQSDVGTGSTGGVGTGASSAGVTITAGTPEDFATRNVGVELAVTPTVEEDDYAISLELNPRVTEFEGFVEYGGSSIAISGGTTVTVPSGFFQPIFSTREINTRVTIWDGATLVMGGLTREEVKRVNDKVPILGDIPILGRAFRSKGESSQKRNLLIFVTANLVSPGGSLKKQELRGVPASSTFQNPALVTPTGPETRVRGN